MSRVTKQWTTLDNLLLIAIIFNVFHLQWILRFEKKPRQAFSSEMS